MSVLPLLALTALFLLTGGSALRAAPPCPMHDWLVWIYVEGETLGRDGPGLIRLDHALRLSGAVKSADTERLSRLMGKVGLDDGLPVVTDYVGLVGQRLSFARPEPDTQEVAQRMQGYLQDLRCGADPGWRADLTLPETGPPGTEARPGHTAGALDDGAPGAPDAADDPSAAHAVAATPDQAAQGAEPETPPETPADSTLEAPSAPRGGAATSTEALKAKPGFSEDAISQGQVGTRLPSMPKQRAAAGPLRWILMGGVGLAGLAAIAGTVLVLRARLRRKAPRTACHMNAVLRLPDGRCPTVAVDISPNGAKLNLTTEPEPGLRGTLELSGVEVPCRIAWSTHFFVGLVFLRALEKAEFETLLHWHRWDNTAETDRPRPAQPPTPAGGPARPVGGSAAAAAASAGAGRALKT
ncbi:PilZ domain-containing protein [Rhodovulum visakhapatnamense]|uniref:PilZ domain-containing protein n=1 Tax=Rhodovulum visakhapatnamense TaxID=364297 RepID=A0A4R8G914_9RHOB|nr:PilZ domain-containing protein [Rhodovulum visakhapatnamense]TDX33649.1 PilZ domain-containing protein [Rhodovulum visakhapatnamense]